MRALAVLLGFLFLVCPPSVMAEKILVEIDTSIPAQYLVTVGADQTVTANPTRVIKPGVAPVPTPTPVPVPQVLTERAKAIKAAAEKVTLDTGKVDTALGLARLYRELATLANTPGAVKNAPALTTGLKAGQDMWLAQRGLTQAASDQWQGMRDVLATQWTVLQARNAPLGRTTDRLGFADLLDEAASGIEAAYPQRGISPELWAFIMKIIELILPLLLR